MIKKTVLAILLVSLLAVMVVGWRLYRHYVPLNVNTLAVSSQDTSDWTTHRNERFGFEMKYPPTYFPCKISSDAVSLRQNTASAAGCTTVGKRIGLRVYPMSHVTSFRRIKLTKDSRLNDISRQFLKASAGPANRRSCLAKKINGIDALICTSRKSGETRLVNGDIFKVFVFGIHETPQGDRLLVEVSNDAGGTTYVGERELHRDTIGIFQTLRWPSDADSGEK